MPFELSNAPLILPLVVTPNPLMDVRYPAPGPAADITPPPVVDMFPVDVRPPGAVITPVDESPPPPITAESDVIAIVFCPVCQKPPISSAVLLRQIR